ncbi:Sulfatase [Enhygromyxa salina]|uniref:Sulfatase n=1 Tax=Enhygromyxa salina TaxID=215803 RepID=A0A2S9XE38_9BACT|nr:sulfatase-like hydrolase/transferase [Enhygromyxa salina]PRP91117.1 Sulfatase [Enhygromyxa salina]
MSYPGWGPFTSPPNILILITDQQSAVQHFPLVSDGSGGSVPWASVNLPTLTSLQAGGIAFSNAITSTCACSPSRATLWTGTYPQTNGVPQTDGQLPTVASGTLNIASMLAAANYQVVYKGKWHLHKDSYDVGGESQPSFITSATVRPIASSDAANEDNLMMQSWGWNTTPNPSYDPNNPAAGPQSWSAWTSPDSGTELSSGPTPTASDTSSLNTLGGLPAVGTKPAPLPANDWRVVHGDGLQATQQSAIDFLTQQSTNPSGPFCLVVALTNPHDIFVYPSNVDPSFPGYDKKNDANYDPKVINSAPFTGFSPPSTETEDISTTKPSTQATLLDNFQGGPLTSPYDTQYVQFYAYLQTLADSLTGDIIGAMSSDLLANTIIIRISDHGEMSQAHGGLREKENTAYRETLNVPVVFSNPQLLAYYQQRRGGSGGVVLDQLVGHVDLLPTLATITGVPSTAQPAFQGRDYSDLLLGNPDAWSPYTTTKTGGLPAVLFTFDDGFVTNMNPVNHIRCIVTPQYKYAVYYGPGYSKPEFEFYDYSTSAGVAETDNLLAGTVKGNTTVQAPTASTVLVASQGWTWQDVHDDLSALMASGSTDTTPSGWQTTPVSTYSV